MPNPWRNYLQNFRDNLPSGVTYRSDIARYIFNDRRFVWPWDVVQYRQYLIKLGFQDDLSQVIELLFSNDEPGFLFTADPETCFTDTAGTTQAEPGDPVALWLDQSGNGNHATQPTTANRPILGRKPKGGVTAESVGSGFDITEPGKPDRWYLYFGGSADPRWMQTPVITPGTDKVQVFAGVRKLSDEATQALIDTSDRWDQNDGAFLVRTTRLSTSNSPTAYSKGTGGNDSTLGTETSAPASMVLAATGDIATPDVTIRVSQDETSSGGAQGTGNYLAYPSYIGARGPGTAHYLHGEISALTARFGPNLTTNQIEQVEAFIAIKVAEDTI